ncbi:1,4-alpha-glucan branching protein GlgB [Actinomycetospora aeridis]|uniref:1,4-alpha-glucan branching enzyme GlgB n=1 Tax=Actinomycetospora aeridis TaxID=3129231 RepID=A0ABU8MZR2_9PSEU
MSVPGSRVRGPASPTPSDLDVHLLMEGSHRDPHGVLGPHRDPESPGTVIVRALRPGADAVDVVIDEGPTAGRYPLAEVHAAGVFAAGVPGPLPRYRLATRRTDEATGETVETIADDPYRFSPVLGPVDLHLIGEGRHERLWDALGAHFRRWPTPSGPVEGTSFTVWAPHARGVRVCGDFDGWDGTTTPMRALGSGVWELFVPGIGDGARYGFRILSPDGHWLDKADPMAFAADLPPTPASVVTTSTHEWTDQDWMTQRAASAPHSEPMSVYEIHLGSWRQGLGYRELADQLAEYLTDTGFTHVELLPVAEHPFGGSWGYQVSSYYAPTSRFGSPDDFRYFVDRLHRAGIGVIVDWVPAHFPKDEWALARFDGTPCYEHGDPRRGEQLDWGTLVFDFGRSQVRNFLVANALYWLDEFHIDGLRVDAVASMLYLDYSRPDGGWTPNRYGGRENLEAVSFLQEVNATVYKNHPSVVTIAEESTAWPGVTRPTHLGGLGFGFKWNMGWMHDTLDYIGRDPVHRSFHHNQMTFSMTYAYSENYVLPLSHDEVVHGKGSLWTRQPGDDERKAAGVRALFGFMWAHPGKQLVFMGGEFGQVREWSEERSLDWELLDDPQHGGLRRLVGDLNAAYRSLPPLWELDTDPAGFSWIDANDATGNVLSFVRQDRAGNPVACIVNFSGADHPNYRVGLPSTGRWREVLNTDADVYGGRGVGNYGAVIASSTSWHGRPASAEVTLPANGVLWLAPA